MKEGWMIKDEGWLMKDDDFKLLRGFDLWRTDGRTDICDCKVAFATENVEQNATRPCADLVWIVLSYQAFLPAE